MDQRKAFKNNYQLDADKNKKNFNKIFGKQIKSLSKSFNHIFVDDIDIEHYKYFVEIIYDIPNKACYRIARKIFKDYKILDIYLDNIDMIGKEYLDYLFLTVIQNLFTNLPGGMQPHRDIINMCKKVYNKTGFIESYYYLARIIYHMCLCCYSPTNADDTALKYYELCLANGFEKQEIYKDLINIYYSKCDNNIANFYKIIDYSTKTTNKQDHIDMIVKLAIKLELNKYIYPIEQIGKFLSISNTNELILEVITTTDAKDIIAALDDSTLIELLTYYYNNYPEYYNIMINEIGKIKSQEKYIKFKLNLFFSLKKYSDMAENLNELLDLWEEEKQSVFSESRYINSHIINCLLDNFDMPDELFTKILTSKYISFDKIQFVLYFDKLKYQSFSKDFLDKNIMELPNYEKFCTYLVHDFGKNHINEAIRFIDGIEKIVEYINANIQDNKKLRDKMIDFLSKINPYCDYDNSLDVNGNKYINPFGQKDLDKLKTYITINDDTDDWDKVYGEDPDYDTVYSTYHDYYNALYKIKETSPSVNIMKANQYIEMKINKIYSIV